MDLAPFLLDQWIGRKHTANPPIEFDLASSTGPAWTLRELTALAGEKNLDFLMDTRVSYVSAAGSADLRAAIANLTGAQADQVQVVTGAEEALLILFFTAAEPGANVVLPSPGFPANQALAESLGIEARFYHLRAENQFAVDPDEIQGLIDRNTKLALVITPHNPTGSVVAQDQLEALHDFCLDRKVQFVVDQVYHPIYHTGAPVAKTSPRIAHATLLGDFSKALCLSGLRLGWMVEPDAARRARYLNARNYFSICSNAIGERLGVLALAHSEAIYNKVRTQTARNLTEFDGIVQEHSNVLRWSRPQGGMTAFPSIEGVSDTRPFCEALLERGVMIAPGDCFGAPSHFRIGFGAAHPGQFARAVRRLGEALRARASAAR